MAKRKRVVEPSPEPSVSPEPSPSPEPSASPERVKKKTKTVDKGKAVVANDSKKTKTVDKAKSVVANPSKKTSEGAKKAVTKKAVEDEAPPGFKTWKSSTMLASGEKLNEAQYNVIAAKFTQVVEVQHNDSFILRPLIIDDGPLKGRHVLVLDPVPVTKHFRFMDLPPELRKMVYECLLDEPEDIKMRTHKAKNGTTRAVRRGFPNKGFGKHTFDVFTGKSIGMPPSNHAILRVSKQTLEEAGPIAYGNNTFFFHDMTYLHVFLKGIGDMRQHLHHVKLGPVYKSSKYVSVFHKLKDAKGLRTLEFNQNIVCLAEKAYPLSPSKLGLVKHCRTLLDTLYKAQKAETRNTDVLDIIKIWFDDSSKCYACRPGFERQPACTGSLSCRTPCKDLQAHCDELTAEIRELVAKELGIEE